MRFDNYNMQEKTMIELLQNLFVTKCLKTDG
jgi:hypothetical protein